MLKINPFGFSPRPLETCFSWRCHVIRKIYTNKLKERVDDKKTGERETKRKCFSSNDIVSFALSEVSLGNSKYRDSVCHSCKRRHKPLWLVSTPSSYASRPCGHVSFFLFLLFQFQLRFFSTLPVCAIEHIFSLVLIFRLSRMILGLRPILWSLSSSFWISLG